MKKQIHQIQKSTRDTFGVKQHSKIKLSSIGTQQIKYIL